MGRGVTTDRPNFSKDFAEFCNKYSSGMISAYNRGLVTLTEVLSTMLDNERNEAIQEALEWMNNYQKQKKLKGVSR